MASSLLNEHWLAEAKRLPVGRWERIYHGAERRPNLVIRNKADGYYAYCHSCHEGSVVKKEFVQEAVVVEQKPKSRDPGPLVDINTLDTSVSGLGYRLVQFLSLKNVYQMWPNDVRPMWSDQDKRIVVQTPEMLIGRDITGNSYSKWYRYKGSAGYASVNGIKQGNTILLTEDYFSAMKGQFYADATGIHTSCVSMQGTVIHPDLVVQLMDAPKVILAFDHDDAGVAGYVNAGKQLSLLGIPWEAAWCTYNNDPKDMWSDWWLKNLT